MASFSTRQLKIKCKTWSRDSYGLYDYETSALHVQNFTIEAACSLSRVENEIAQGELPPQSTPNETPQAKETKTANTNKYPALALISEDQGGIKVMANQKDQMSTDDLFWHIVERGESAEGYMLKTGDIIRLGRVVFKINQIKVLQQGNPDLSPHQKGIMESIKAHMEKDGVAEGVIKSSNSPRPSINNMICKICLSEKEELDDPLISPCDCTGSMKFVHLKCIQNWVKSKLNMQQNKNIVTIFYKNLYCELCKAKFPVNISHEGEVFSLIPIADKISGSYVVLESFSKEKDSTGIHFIDLSSNQDFKMGRGHDCDLKIPDISVSRVHALLVASKGKLYLKDNLSKFGTLVLHRGPIILTDDNPKSPWIQCGRSIFKFTLKKPWVSFLPCVGNFFGLNRIPQLSRLFGEKKNNTNSNAHNETHITQEDETLIRTGRNLN